MWAFLHEICNFAYLTYEHLTIDVITPNTVFYFMYANQNTQISTFIWNSLYITYENLGTDLTQ